MPIVGGDGIWLVMSLIPLYRYTLSIQSMASVPVVFVCVKGTGALFFNNPDSKLNVSYIGPPNSKITAMKAIRIEKLVHGDRVFACIYFTYEEELVEIMKRSKGARWSKKKKCWWMPYEAATLREVIQKLSTVARITLPDGSIYLPGSIQTQRRRDPATYDPAAVSAFTRYLEGRRMSPSTVGTYSGLIGDFFHYLNYKPVAELTNRDVEKFCEDILAHYNYSVSTQRQFISAVKKLKGLYPECRIDDLRLERPKKSRHIPNILSKEEVIRLLRFTRNLKHRAALGMIYSAGLRISELLNLQLSDLDFHRRQVFIRQGKGRKDRVVILAESMIPLLTNYLGSYQPKEFFIEGPDGGRYSAGSVRSFLRQACQRAGIQKRVTPHTLRHSYATHLLESGIDIRYIQELLGHSRPETTMIYTHVARKDLLQITSPLDNAIAELMESEKLKNPGFRDPRSLLP